MADVDPDEPLDTEGEAPPPSGGAIAGCVDEAMRLMAWSRQQGFQIGSLQVGDVIVNGLKDTKPRFRESAGPRGPRDIYEEYGGLEESA